MAGVRPYSLSGLVRPGGQPLGAGAVMWKSDGTLIIAGDLGPDALDDFNCALKEQMGSGTLDIDLNDVAYMSSTFLGVIMTAVAESVRKGAQPVVRAAGQVRRLLQLAGLPAFGVDVQ